MHHAIFYRVSAAEVPAARELDAGDPGRRLDLLRRHRHRRRRPGRALAGEDWVAAWAPGGLGEDQTPAGTGYLLRPGDQLVMQVHYNLLDGPAGQSDRPGIRLRLMAASAALTPLHTTLLPAPVELPCPSGRRAGCATGRWRCWT